MVYRVRTTNGTTPVIREYMGGGAGVAGDIVKLGSNDKITVAAAGAEEALGWLTGDMEDGKPVNVMEANDFTEVEMPFTGEVAEGMLGGYFALSGTSGAQKVDLSDTGHDLFKLTKVTRNGTATGHAATDFRCFVIIPSSKSQAIVEA